jgi:hypothetical protein
VNEQANAVGMGAMVAILQARSLTNADGDRVHAVVRVRDCDVCHGSGWVATALTPLTGALAPCACSTDAAMRDRSVAMLRARMVEDSRLDGLDVVGARMARSLDELARIPAQGYLIAIIRRWLDELAERPVLAIVGAVGNGKTQLAIAGALSAAERYHLQPLLWPVADGMQHQADHMTDGEAAETLRRVKAAEVAVLDDLGTQMPSNMSANRLYQILNSRYVSGLPTIITSNQPLRQLDERLQRALDYDLSRIVVNVTPNLRTVGITASTDANAPRQRPPIGRGAWHAIPERQVCGTCHTQPCICTEEDR